tara:strand:- start:4916 stop:5206 length:291 start_codon:yes stop_codon:yes gene_type:complete
MGNTLLYWHPEIKFIDSDKGHYAYYRSWDGGKGGLTFYSRSLRKLGIDMRRSEPSFREPFDPEGGIPDKEWGNVDPSKLRPLNEVEVSEVLEFLRG